MDERCEWWMLRWGNISSVKVDHFTEKSVWIDGKRRSRDGWESYYPTWDRAHAQLLEEAERELENAKGRLDRAQIALSKIKAMKRPDSAGDGNGNG